MAVAEQDYLSGYEGLSHPVTFDQGPNHADAISGATYSSRAIRSGVNLAMEYIDLLDDISYLENTADTNTSETEEAGNE
jgi:major membrane immunogen (membrane-anchored lipoprotein)